MTGVTCTKYLVKLDRVVVDFCEQTDSQTDNHRNTTQPYRGRGNQPHNLQMLR